MFYRYWVWTLTTCPRVLKILGLNPDHSATCYKDTGFELWPLAHRSCRYWFWTLTTCLQFTQILGWNSDDFVHISYSCWAWILPNCPHVLKYTGFEPWPLAHIFKDTGFEPGPRLADTGFEPLPLAHSLHRNWVWTLPPLPTCQFGGYKIMLYLALVSILLILMIKVVHVFWRSALFECFFF